MAFELIEEKIILKGLVKDRNYFTSLIPYLDKSLFSENVTRKVFECISRYNEKYRKEATVQVLELFAGTVKQVSEEEYQEIVDIVNYIKEDTPPPDSEWLMDQTVEWIKRRKYFNSIIDAANSFEKGELDTSLPSKLQDTLGFHLGNNIGLTSTENERKYELYTSQEDKIPFLLAGFNNLTCGGVAKGGLHMLLSSTTGGGKTLSKCSLSAQYVMQGYNVLYITLELKEAVIMRRIEGTLLDMGIDDIPRMDKSKYLSRMEEIQAKYHGKYKAVQFPPGACTDMHLRRVIEEIRTKEGWTPDILVVDYLGLLMSSRYKVAKKYEILASAAEELRGVCVEYNMLGWTSQQSNREGMNEPENLSLDNISESLGISYTMDLIVAIITNEQFQKDKKLYFHSLKNRYKEPGEGDKFFLGVDYPKMKLYDLQDGYGNSVPAYQNMASGTSCFQSQTKRALGFADIT